MLNFRSSWPITLLNFAAKSIEKAVFLCIFANVVVVGDLITYHQLSVTEKSNLRDVKVNSLLDLSENAKLLIQYWKQKCFLGHMRLQAIFESRRKLFHTGTRALVISFAYETVCRCCSLFFLWKLNNSVTSQLSF